MLFNSINFETFTFSISMELGDIQVIVSEMVNTVVESYNDICLHKKPFKIV